MTIAGEEQRPAVLAAEGLREAINRASQRLFELQRSDGHWCGELEGDSILESESILLFHSLGRLQDPLVGKLAAYLRKIQTSEGGWSIFPGGPNDVSATVKAYFALKLAGDHPDAPHMTRAREAALRLGGVTACNSFTKIYLAHFGQYEWQHVPAIPPEIILLPGWFYVNIYAMSSWSRTILVPLAVIWAYRPHCPVPEGCDIDELFVGGRANADLSLRPQAPFPSFRHFFLLVDRVLKWLDGLPVRPWRRQALRAAEGWMLARFPKTDGLGAIFPPIVNAIWALKCLGYPLESTQIRSQVDELLRLVIEDGAEARVQPCTSPVWDTAISCIALNESRLPSDHPALVSALRWIEAREVKEPGDWMAARPNLQPGGWAFEYSNEYYPDVDDTAMVLIAMSRLSGVDEGVRQRAMNWLLGMQCKNGGWGSFDADNDRWLLCEFPFADHNAMIDPPTADITARVLEMLGAYGYGLENEVVQRAVAFLRHEQEDDGSWFGRWGVNYVYGTWQSLIGLTAVGIPASDPMIQKGVGWLESVQNPDGGWGESCQSYEDPGTRGQGVSTASQTAWAIMGILAAGRVRSRAVEAGIDYLLRTQREDGSWDEPYCTGTGFPKVFYLNYHLYRLSFPLYAISMYRRLTESAVSGAVPLETARLRGYVPAGHAGNGSAHRPGGSLYGVSSNGKSASGISTGGLPGNGATISGATVNGATLNGATTTDARTDGAAIDDATIDDENAHAASTNGSSSSRPNSVAVTNAKPLTTNGVSPHSNGSQP